MCAMAERPRLDSVLSFNRDPAADAGEDRPANDPAAASDTSSDYDEGDDDGFEFAFAPALTAAGHEGDDRSLALADDLFSHGRILPAYPVWDRRGVRDGDESPAAPPSPDSYCAWAPRSAPGSPAREFPKSASASAGEARRFWRLRDLVGGRSHSDGKEKFVFLQPAATAPSKMSSAHGVGKQSSKPSAPLQQQQQQKQGKKKSKQAGAVTEMDMATAHRLFYSKQPGDRRPQQQQSYLPYRPGIVGFFATAHALGRSHHPY